MNRKTLLFLAMIIFCAAQIDAGYLVCQQGDLPLLSQKIKVSIKNQVAVTSLEQIFYNPHAVTIQPNIRFPIHEKASVQGFSLTDSTGQTYSGTIEETNKATQEFNEAKEQGMMPALAVQKQPGVFETSIGAIGPNSRTTVTIEYSEILDYKAGEITYNLPFNVSSWQKKELDQVSLQIEVADQKEITGVTSTSHDVYANKLENNVWQVSFERNNFLPNQDFSLKYSVKAEAMAVNFLSTRPDPEKDGFFVLMLSPQEIVSDKDIADRDIVFVMDTSGSMGGNRIAQTKRAFFFFVERLNNNDRFAIVQFSDTVSHWRKELVQATYENRVHARTHINGLMAHGGTNINDALLEALNLFDDDQTRTKAIVFLTDGEASTGITATSSIVGNYRTNNQKLIRTFTIGVGSGVNKPLLGQLAAENRGEAVYLAENASIEKDLSGYYETISTPLLVDLKLDFGPIEVSEVFPPVLPNVYKGTQIVVTGRYKNSGEAAMKLTGMLNNEEKVFPVNATFIEDSSENSFVSRYWARTKADELLKQIKIYGEKPELKEQVIALSKDYQFATPYTSFIAVSAEQVPQVDKAAPAAHKSAAYANIRNTAAPKRVVVQKTKAKSVSLWGAAGFVPFAVAIPNFRKAREQARHKACYANMRVLLGAVEMYNMDHPEDQMISVLTEREIGVLIAGKYLKSEISRPEPDCVYGTIGDLTGTGRVCCSVHGTVEEETDDKTQETAIFADGADGFVTHEYVAEQTPWTTRIWNDYLADAVNLLINVPLFILGLAFSLYLFYHIIVTPFKIIAALFGWNSNNE